MDDWRACKDWVLEDGKPNLQFLSAHFGKSQVQVADCGIREFTDQKRLEMSVSDFIEKWVELCSSRKSSSTKETDGKPLLYLKDWHFVKEYTEYCAYKTPLFFCDDWLNIYLDRYHMHMDPDSYQEKNELTCSDYRFVYMGAKGTWTPLHADVFRSYSWSANVSGKKQWILLPPSQYQLVFDRNMKNSVYNIFEDVSEATFPGFKEEDTISINHNWFNAYNVSWVWDLLLRDYKEARHLIEDIRDICDDFEGLCQRNLAANTGMNFHDFLVFMVRFTFANLFQLHHLSRLDKNSLCQASEIVHHTVFNLRSVQSIALKMKSDGVCTNLGILMNVKETLEDYSFAELFATLKETYGTIHGPYEISCVEKMVLCSHMKAMVCDFSSSVGASEDLDILINFAFRKLGLAADENLLFGEVDDS